MYSLLHLEHVVLYFKYESVFITDTILFSTVNLLLKYESTCITKLNRSLKQMYESAFTTNIFCYLFYARINPHLLQI